MMTWQESATSGGGTQEIDATRWRQLAVAMAGAFLILLDSTIVNVAVPSIQRDFGSEYSAVEWVVTAYALAYGVLLIPGGRLGDRFGHKTLFMISVAGFAIASILCGTAQSVGQLIAWQVVLGAMAGLMNPQILAVIQTAFPWQERGKAYAIYGAVSGFATAVAPLLAGLLIQWNIGDYQWRPIFLVNVPIAIVALAAAARIMRPTKGRGGSLDPLGIVMIAVTVFLIGFPLIEGQSQDWPVWIFVMLAAAVPLLIAFVVWEQRRGKSGHEPLIDIGMFRNRAFSAGVGIGFAYFAGFISLWFILSVYLQSGLQRSALTAGLILLPFALGTLFGSMFSDKAHTKLGKWVMSMGLGVVMVGLAGILGTAIWVGPTMSGWELTPWLLIAGIGSGLVIAPNVDVVMSGVGWSDAGSAAGVLNVAQRLGSALGIALAAVAFFGILKSASVDSAEHEAPQLRSELIATQMLGTDADVDAAVQRFVDCYDKRSHAKNWTDEVPGCPLQATEDPVGTAFASAIDRTVKRNFTTALMGGTGVSLGLVTMAFLLVFALPARKPEGADGSWGDNAGEWTGNAGGGEWSGGTGGGEWTGSAAESGDETTRWTAPPR
ncbi:MFS transporter [Nocardia sp. NPDC056000]|uniref:MFS transporter n=1 Tax=Nocardia sp. NPDC056000 TaxID=3345674 RepID=UPI0035DE46FD